MAEHERGCPHCEAGGYTYSEAYRRECEARYVAQLPGREARAEYLKAVAQHRGRGAAERLRQDVLALWRTGRMEAMTA